MQRNSATMCFSLAAELTACGRGQAGLRQGSGPGVSGTTKGRHGKAGDVGRGRGSGVWRRSAPDWQGGLPF